MQTLTWFLHAFAIQSSSLWQRLGHIQENRWWWCGIHLASSRDFTLGAKVATYTKIGLPERARPTQEDPPSKFKNRLRRFAFCTPSVWKNSLLGFDPSSHASCASLEKTDLLSERKPQTCNTKIVQSSLWIYKIFYHLSAEEGQQEYIITVSHTFSQWSENLLTPVMEKPRWELAQNLDLRFFSSPFHGLKQHHFETSLRKDL